MVHFTVRESIHFYFTNTTLHGLKQLIAPKIKDRIAWLLGCIASTACAAVLCAVIWWRFLKVPAVLTVHPYNAHQMPTIAICPPFTTTARLIADQLVKDETDIDSLSKTIILILSSKSPRTKELAAVDKSLNNANITFTKALIKYAPLCSLILNRCRLHGVIMNCDHIFKIKLRESGVCCESKMNNIKYEGKGDLAELSLVLNCTDSYHIGRGHCRLYTHYKHEEDINPNLVRNGKEYHIFLKYVSVQDSAEEKLITGPCLSQPGYNHRKCLLECTENICGCSDPLRSEEDGPVIFPYCSVLSTINCLRNLTTKTGNQRACPCPPACEKLKMETNLQSGTMISTFHTLDQLYSDIDVSSTTVAHIRMQSSHSRTLISTRTESWLTLMSSLGGIFNMFMGFGLFSALEFLFFLFICLPDALKSPTNVAVPTVVTTAPNG